jgi:hypothetical protein
MRGEPDRKVGGGLTVRDNGETPACYNATRKWVAFFVEKVDMMNEETAQEGSLGARNSFVVRIWRDEGNASWRGWIQDTRSGESAAVCDLDDLLAFVERRTGALRSGAGNLR